MATTKLMSADDLMHMPDDLNRYDLIEGVLHRMPPASLSHGAVVFAIGMRIGQYVESHHLGMMFAAETGFQLARDPDTVLAPDVAFLRDGRIPSKQLMQGFAPVAPDLVVEVRSPSDRRSEIMIKIDIYLKAGVAMVWFVEPDKREVTVYRPDRAPQVLGRNDVLDGEDVLPGFALPLRDILPDD